MTFVVGLSFAEARSTVTTRVTQARRPPDTEFVSLQNSYGRILAEPARADRDYPPLARSVRDGFAVRAADLPGRIEVIGEVRAGDKSGLTVGPGQSVEIMTGAPVPPGADAIVMVEHVTRNGNHFVTTRSQRPGDFINPQGAEARAGQILLEAGEVITYPRIALLATVGAAEVRVYRRPRVAILATGDEIVGVEEAPLDYQIRNSNSYALAAQVRRAGGEPLILPVARDEYQHTRELIQQGLEADLLLLSGGVSAGKFDIVEQVLADLGAEFYFTRVLIQPGQPLVFGRAGEKFFFGLPGNPVSTMVTFEVFARAALELLAGRASAPLPLLSAQLTTDFRHKTGLTRFLPALVDPGGLRVTPVQTQGSSDVPAVARANAFLVAAEDRESWQAGDMIPVLLHQ